MIYSLVLSDALYQEFHAFKHGQSHDSLVVEKLLHLYIPPLAFSQETVEYSLHDKNPRTENQGNKSNLPTMENAFSGKI